MAKPVRKIKKLLKSVSKVIKKAVSKPAKKPPVAKKRSPLKPKKAVRKKPTKAARRTSSIAKGTPVSDVPIERTNGDARLPRYYCEDKLVLLVRDPWWLFAYWEVTPGRREEIEYKARGEGYRDWKTVLRVYDVTRNGAARPDSFFDIELNFYTDNWYIDVGIPSRQWMAEIGLRMPDGRFLALVRSNVVGTPGFGLSQVLDEEWMLPEDVYLKLIGFTGLGAQSGSMDIRKMLEKYLQRVVSSESSPRAPLAR